MQGSPPPPGFVAEFREHAAKALQVHVKPVPGISEVLQKLPLPYCVASSGEHEKIRLTLSASGLLHQFDNRIFSVVDVPRPKPAPDVFLYAARCLGAAPSRCVVIEDTPTGVRAAVAAGMRAYGFSANTPAHRLIEAGAHEVFSHMPCLPELLISS